MQPILYVAITNHGFGHATRTASLVADIKALCPDMAVIMVTTAPRWLLESYLGDDFIHRPRGFDVGVLQQDSLTMDKIATLDKLKFIQSHQNSIIASEVSFIQQNRVGLVLADIPPLATAIAHTAGIPCWMASNFGWDLIYRPWGGEFEAVSDWIVDQFSQCDRLFRLPFHEPMSAFPIQTDVGLTGGSPRYSADDLRSKFALDTSIEKTVLLTFGGLGLAEIPYGNLAQFPDWQFITFDRNAPDLPNLLKIEDRLLRPVDLMPLCSRIVCKPGYGTYAEACRLGLPVITLTRDDFAEAHYLLEGIQDYAVHQILSPADFFEGDWQFLMRDFQPPRTGRSLPTDGNTAIAQAVVDYFTTAA